MDTSQFELSRRTALGLAGAVAVTLSSMTEAFALPSAADDMKHPQRQDVSCLINGEPAQIGSYAFPSEIDTLVLDNGLIRFTFGRDDPAGGVVTGWPNVSVTATSIIVDGIESVGWPGASQPPAPTDPYVTVSRHTALVALII